MANFSKSFNFRNGVQVDDDKFIVKPITGLVGISNTLPTETLDVIGNVKATGISSAGNIFAGAGVTVGTGVSQISIDGGTGIITAVSFRGDGSLLTNIVAIATAGFVERAGTLSTTTSVGIGSLNVGTGGSFPDFTLDVLGDMRVTGPSTFVGLTTVSGDLFTTQFEVSGVSTFSGLIDANGVIEGISGQNKIPSLYNELSDLPSASTYHGMFAHVHATGKGYYAHAGNWIELVNKDTSGNVALSGNLDVDGHTELDNLNVSGVSTFVSDMNVANGSGIIEDAGGQLKIRANAFNFKDISNTRQMLFVSQLGGAKLYHNGTQQFETLGSGATVYGTTQTQQLNVSGVSTFVGVTNFNNILVGSAGTVGFAKSLSMSDGAQINLGDQDDLVIKHTGTNSEIVGLSTIKILSNNLVSANISGLKTSIDATPGGVVNIFHDGVEKFNTSGSGISVLNSLTLASLNGGTSGLSTHNADIIYGEEGGSSPYSTRRSFSIRNNDSGNFNYFINQNNLKDSGVDRTGNFNWIKGSSSLMTLTGIGGSLGIGITDPTADLHVVGPTILDGTVSLPSGSLVANVTGNVTGNVDGNLTGNVFAGIITATDYIDGNLNVSTGISRVQDLLSLSDVGIGTLVQGRPLNINSTPLTQVIVESTGQVGIQTDALRTGVTYSVGIFGNAQIHGAVSVGNTDIPLAAIDFSDVVNVPNNSAVDRSRVAYMIPPKVTTSQRSNLYNGKTLSGSPAAGAFIYNTTANRLELYNGTTWVGVSSATGTGITQLEEDGSPTLGGNLDINNKFITGTGGINLTGVVTSTSLVISDYIYHSGDTNTFIGFESNDTIRFNTNGSDKLKINSSGHLILLDDNDTYIHRPSANTLTFTTGGSERLRINSSGITVTGTCSGNVTGNLTGEVNAAKFDTNTSGVVVTGVATATSFSGSGASLTGLTGASAGTYGNATTVPQIVVNSDGRITGITNVLITGGGGGGGTGTGVVVKDSDSLVGAAGTINFGTNLSVTPVSAGIVTVTASLTGVSTTGTSVFNQINASGIITASSFSGDGSNLTGLNSGTVSSGTFTASAGSPSTLDTYAYNSSELVFEYTIFVKNGSNYQSQKLLVMRDGTTVTSTQYGIMYSNSLLAQFDAATSGSNLLLRATPEAGVSGSTTYRIKREVT